MENILFEIRERIGIITLNRPTKLNALNKVLIDELITLLHNTYHNPEISGVLITGAGPKAFVAGADIQELSEMDENSSRELVEYLQKNLFDFIAESDKPHIACINGYALGGGLELALACHIRYASENAVFGLPELGLGIIPGYGGTQRLTETVGKSLATEMMLTGESIHAHKALEIGLINAILPMEDLVEHGFQKLLTIQKKAPLAISACLRAIHAFGLPDKEGFGIEIDEFSHLFTSLDFKEGTKAFLQKRPPLFVGK